VQLREIVGESAGLLETSLTTHTVIAISALGRALEKRDGRDVLVGDPEPWNALRPLRWVLEHGAPRPAAPLPDPSAAPTIEVARAVRPEVSA
jgi:hypothetical protein